MRFLFVLLLLCSPAFADIQMDADTPDEVLVVRALIERFDDTEIVIRTEPTLTLTPVFVIYAKAVACLGDCAVDPLVEALEDENLQVRQAASIALRELGPSAIKAKPLLKEMLQSEDGYTNILACVVICGIGPDAVDLVDLIRACLHDENFHVQYWACKSLGKIGSNAVLATDELIELLKNGVASVRRNAALALGDISKGIDDKSTVIKALEEATRDWSSPVRTAAEEALTKIGANDVG